MKPSAKQISMRLRVLWLPFIAAALLSQTPAISAQSHSDYAWCAVADARNCYYTSREQCLESNSGIAFLCIPNPAYRPPQAAPEPAPPDPAAAAAVSPRKRRQPQ
jgi:Protein of unknown function (DUF3551)